MAKYKTRRGMAVIETEEKLDYRKPMPTSFLLIAILLSILPFLTTNIDSTWLAMLALLALTLIILGLWFFFSPYAKPV